MIPKICNTCNINKDISLFWKNKAKPDWYDRECSACRREYKKKFYVSNLEKERNRLSISRKTESWRFHRANYRHRRRQLIYTTSDNTVTQEALDDILLTQNYLCNMCKCNIEHRSSRHLDHIFPLSKWWLHTITNLQWLCSICNISKGARILGEPLVGEPAPEWV